MEKIYIKNEKLFKNKTQMVIYLIIFLGFFWAFEKRRVFFAIF